MHNTNSIHPDILLADTCSDYFSSSLTYFTRREVPVINSSDLRLIQNIEVPGVYKYSKVMQRLVNLSRLYFLLFDLNLGFIDRSSFNIKPNWMDKIRRIK